MNSTSCKVSKKPKYPYIDTFVRGMSDINAKDYIQRDDDLKSLLLFMMLYVRSVRELDNEGCERSDSNISDRMKYLFENERHSYIENLVSVNFSRPPGLSLPSNLIEIDNEIYNNPFKS